LRALLCDKKQLYSKALSRWPLAVFKTAALNRSATLPDACRRGIWEAPEEGVNCASENRKQGGAHRIPHAPVFESGAIAARSSGQPPTFAVRTSSAAGIARLGAE
jgi:hypothetical protein